MTDVMWPPLIAMSDCLTAVVPFVDADTRPALTPLSSGHQGASLDALFWNNRRTVVSFRRRQHQPMSGYMQL